MSWAAGRQMVLESVSDARQLLGIPAQTGADTQKVDLNNKCLEEMSAAEVCWSDFDLTPMTLQTNHPGKHCAVICGMTTVTQCRCARRASCTVATDTTFIVRRALPAVSTALQPTFYDHIDLFSFRVFTPWRQIAKPKKKIHFTFSLRTLVPVYGSRSSKL